MKPHYELSTKWTLTKPNGDTELFDELPCATCAIDDDKEFSHGESYTVTCERGWFARLSANGYLDCTEWAGPFDSEEDAHNYIADTYEVDPDTGDPLPEENAAA
jgi:hypothetical protein